MGPWNHCTILLAAYCWRLCSDLILNYFWILLVFIDIYQVYLCCFYVLSQARKNYWRLFSAPFNSILIAFENIKIYQVICVEISLEWVGHFERIMSDLKVWALIHFEGSVNHTKCLVHHTFKELNKHFFWCDRVLVKSQFRTVLHLIIILDDLEVFKYAV